MGCDSTVVGLATSCQIVPSSKKRGLTSTLSGAVSQTSANSPSPPLFSFQPLCSCPNKPFQFRLVDSGVDDNSNDSNLVLQVEILAEEITPPRGCSWWKIATLHYSPYCSHHLISGNHWETIQLLVISSPNSPVFLGLPWLKLNNPHIGWSTGSIISWSIFCHSHCLKLAITLVALSLSSPPEPPDLSSVPSEYHDLVEVFGK